MKTETSCVQGTLALRCKPHTAHRELSAASFSPEARGLGSWWVSPHCPSAQAPNPTAMTSGTDTGQEGPIRLGKGGALEQSVLREGLQHDHPHPQGLLQVQRSGLNLLFYFPYVSTGEKKSFFFSFSRNF